MLSFGAMATAETTLTRQQRHYRKQREKILAKKHAKDAENREKINAEARARRAANPEHARAKDRKNHAKHREKRNAYGRQRYHANAAEIQAKHAQYLKDHPEVVATYNRNRKARMNGATIRNFTAAQWEDMKAHYRYRCVYCGVKPDVLTQDHIIPLSKGGDHTMSNIVPACRSCNCSKKAGPPLKPVQPLLL